MSIFFYCYCHHRDLHSFPTRRSSDLAARVILAVPVAPPDIVWRLEGEADELRVLHSPSPFAAVGQWYGEFRSEEHTSELQSHSDLVCRLLLEKKKTSNRHIKPTRVLR